MKTSFTYRMKKIIKNKSLEKQTSETEDSKLGFNVSAENIKPMSLQTKMERKLSHKPLHISESFRCTMSSRYRVLDKLKIPERVSKLEMPQIIEIKQNKNREPMQCSPRSGVRPVWKQLNLHPAYRWRSPNSNNKKCAIFRKNSQDSEIQFYKTNSIFILKKVKDPTATPASPSKITVEFKPAEIKFKKRQPEPDKIQKKQQRHENNLQSITDCKIEPWSLLKDYDQHLHSSSLFLHS